ncbi:dephospho-CoA kinase [Paenibacillus aurantius]|uniref:Dephospho-CoA kinase n=1 Tax=Paenibacillus aurantius TaxID=2918900 RepID=A0AA96LCW4_9BACL|nr:dephospho-CoA kinase [Paenibacillus aurantius]WJH34668.1 dephospho-CoA kinase [Paenibacillus sp. CC-CFT747]WNQ09875.1 dephospho-CoA kinase [Paenibacillus aurantius]
MNIGLTGGIACGKSTVSQMLVRRGAVLIDADRIAREVVLPGSAGLALVAERFGQAVLDGDGSLNRRKLGEIVFKDEAARKDLEGILHPLIRQEMWSRMSRYEQEDPSRLVVVDIPLLYESGLQEQVQEVMVVYIPRELQKERLMKRDGLGSEEADRRLNAQLSIEDKKALADYVIDNSGTQEDTERQVDRFWQEKGLR